MKRVKFLTVQGVVVAVCLLFLAEIPVVWSTESENENHCFTCHTNPRKLIKITREIAKADLNKPGASIETVGEG